MSPANAVEGQCDREKPVPSSFSAGGTGFAPGSCLALMRVPGCHVDTERRAVVVEGVVQGVGFRPFVHALAERLGLGGFVRNDAGVVRIEVEGPSASLDEFR